MERLFEDLIAIARQRLSKSQRGMGLPNRARKMTDGERTVVGIRRMEGKRLMYRTPQGKVG